MRLRLLSFLGCVAVAAAALATVGSPAASGDPLARPSDPVVLTGAQLPTLANGPRGTIVGFRWSGSAWVGVPIQVDERAVVNFGKIYNNPNATYYSSKPALTSALVYTAGAYWTGNDPNPKFDADDELVFMARDAGVQSAGGQPAGTLAGTGVEVHVTDPLAPGSEGYVYLFRKAAGSGLKQAPGKRYVTYTFKLLSGKYKTTYGINDGPNAENSTVKTATYTHHFGDRWQSDGITIVAPGASKVDILDRHRALFSPGFCGRSEDTFDGYAADANEGVFVINKNGPVRSIRSYLGANSGPNTQRTHIFYDRREDIVTDLRVHAIPSIMDYFDYSAAATGMTYRNDLNPGGFTIDGNPDTPVAGAPTWEQVTGAQGTVTHVGKLETNWTMGSVTNYQLDDTTPPYSPCTGDAFFYGASGTYVNSNVPCTDPSLGCTNTLKATRTLYYDAPGGTAASAAAYASGVATPLTASTAVYTP
jgi:hypothetical protein